MLKFLNTNKLFSADDRNYSKKGLKLANSISIEDLITIGKESEENNVIDEIEAGKLQAEINDFLYGKKIP